MFHPYKEEDQLPYVFFIVANKILYDEPRLREILELPKKIGLEFHNYSFLDVALDSLKNFPAMLKRLIRNENISTILNGKKVQIRERTLPNTTFSYSSSLKKLEGLSITIKQKKADKDKTGITVQAYDKKYEIKNVSKKDYILKYHGDPPYLYRLEVRIPSCKLHAYCRRLGITQHEDLFFDKRFIEDLFYHYLSSVIRFTKNRTKLDWRELIKCNGRVL